MTERIEAEPRIKLEQSLQERPYVIGAQAKDHQVTRSTYWKPPLIVLA